MGIDYYGILQVNRNSTELEIKKAYYTAKIRLLGLDFKYILLDTEI